MLNWASNPVIVNNLSVKPKKQKFYSRAYLYFILALVVTFAGFYQSYFKKLGTTDPWHHFHGMLATIWMLMLIVEPFLYSAGKYKWHRNLGKLSYVIVPLLIVSAFKMIQTMIIGKAAYPPMVVYQLGFLDIFYVLQFLLFFVMAIVKRRQLHEHARYMAATVFIFVGPGLTRLLFVIPVLDTFGKVMNVCYILIEAALVLLILDDERSGKIRLPYILALALFLVQHILFFQVATWQWWTKLLDAYAAVKW